MAETVNVTKSRLNFFRDKPFRSAIPANQRLSTRAFRPFAAAWFQERDAWAFALCVVILPSSATFRKRFLGLVNRTCLAEGIAASDWFTAVRQTGGGCSAGTGRRLKSSLVRLRRCCVNRVKGPVHEADFRVADQNLWHTLSATGATAKAQVCAVSESHAAKEPTSRQLPSRCSKNHSRRNDS